MDLCDSWICVIHGLVFTEDHRFMFAEDHRFM